MSSHLIVGELLQSVDALPVYGPVETLVLSAAELRLFLKKVGTRAESVAKRAVKNAKGNVGLLRGTNLYKNLEEPEYFRAAVVAEVLRSSNLLRNAGHLNLAMTQERIRRVAAHRSEAFTYEIGWGQAKRDAGYLKTIGYGADLAEVVAISRLMMLSMATQMVYDRTVSCRVICGGDRFYEALFTDSDNDAAYNRQRSVLAEAISNGGCVVSFENAARYWSKEDILARLKTAMLEKPFHTSPAEHLWFALFNVDWRHVLKSSAALNPHGIQTPQVLERLCERLSETDRSELIRNLIANVINPRLSRGYFLTCGVGPDDSALLALWMKNVCELSAYKYDLIGSFTRREAAEDEATFVVSAVNKRGDVGTPTFMLLGRRGPDILPQHVVPVIRESRRLRYVPYVSCVNEVRPVFVETAEEPGDEFAWLTASVQPFCFVSSPGENAAQLLGNAEIFED